MASQSNSHLECRFEKAAKHLQMVAGNLESTSLLELYGLYKQATCGPCNTAQPSWFNVTAKRKWEAWKNLGDLSRDDAMDKYVTVLTTLDPDWEDGDESDAFSAGNWVSVSCPVIEPEEVLNDVDKTLLDWAKEGAIDKVKQLSETQDINQWDEEGMTALHWAADRGNIDMMQCLITLKADVNFQDSEGQTALHYAASCGHVKVLEMLLSHQADAKLVDKEGDTPADVASCPEIIEILQHVS
jgi:acyl-CoA-binding protein